MRGQQCLLSVTSVKLCVGRDLSKNFMGELEWLRRAESVGN